MRQKRKTRPFGLAGNMIVLLGALATLATVPFITRIRSSSRPPGEKYELADVQRSDLYPTTTAGGRVESSKRTLIECELENITIGIRGERMSAGGASILLSVIPDGSFVKRGDVLAELDSSDYEELVRQQKITVERSRADFNQAQLAHEIAKLRIHEFQEGSMKESIKDFQRSLALARSDVERISDRLSWARRMKQKGYVATSQVTAEEYNSSQAQFSLTKEKSAYDLFIQWTVPKTLRTMEGQVKSAEATLNYQQSRLKRNLERLAKLEKQVELCTIRAPHDGFVIYANEDYRNVRIEPGIPVHQKQDLFYLPDLTQMEVVTMLHQSNVEQVAKGMRARVVVEGLPNRKLEGHVVSVAQVPTFNWRSDVRYFAGAVKLDNPPQGLRPGMTAEVEIALKRVENVLTVPVEAVTTEEGHEVCYVAREDGLERREVKLGQATSERLEISEGLQEGEQVVLNPPTEEVASDIVAETFLPHDTQLTEASRPEPAPVALH